MPNEKVEQMLSDSRLAFLNQQNDAALNLASQAIRLEAGNADAYKCAGNALMSLERYDEAVENYVLAVKCDGGNGNRYFDLGFAQATGGNMADAMKNLAKADELGCIPENMIQLYQLLGLICFDMGRYDDALVNLSKAEQLAGVNLDILQRKAVIYGIRNDIQNGLHIANQIKLIAPSEYTGYKIAFRLLIQAKRLDTARTELQKAAKYTRPAMDFYFDQMMLELETYNVDKDRIHFHKALGIIEKALNTVEPEITAIAERYIDAAEIYLQLENADKTLECLNAAQAPAEAYNNGFSVVDKDVAPPAELDEYAIEEMIEADRLKMEEELGEYGLEELFENTEPDETGGREFFTEIEEEEAIQPSFQLDISGQYELSAEHRDQIYRLYIGAYTLKRDFEKVITYAKLLQAGEGVQNIYIGKYTELNALKEMGDEKAPEGYREAIKFFRNAMIKDPADIMAVTFRVQCCIDIGDYTQAEEVCRLLSDEIREPLLEKIAQAKSGGD